MLPIQTQDHHLDLVVLFPLDLPVEVLAEMADIEVKVGAAAGAVIEVQARLEAQR